MLKAILLVSLLSLTISHSFLATEYLTNPSPHDIEMFTKGVIEGTHLFDGIKICHLDDPEIKEDVNKIIQIISQIKSLEDIMPAITALLPLFKHIQERIIAIAPECKESEKEVVDIVKRLLDYLSDPNYQTKLVSHTLLNAVKITTKFTTLKEHLDKGEVNEDTGKMAGDLAEFVLFWNFK